MSEEWGRPNWQPGGRDAQLYYFLPGKSPSGGLRLSRSRHHVEGFPEPLQVAGHHREENPGWFEGFFARPGLGSAIDEAFGNQADAIRAIQEATVVHGCFPDPADLGYLRDTIGVVSAILDMGGLGVLDLPACRWWSREEWLDTFVVRTGFAMVEQITVICSDDEQHHPGVWVHTRGMRKFGRPDLQIQHILGPWPGENPQVNAAGDMLHSLAAMLGRGGNFEDGDALGFPGTPLRAVTLLTPDDTETEACHFGNEVLELVDLQGNEAGNDLNQFLGWLSAQPAGDEEC